MICPYNGVCEVVSRKAQCTCDLKCSTDDQPVCGSDIKSYDNECKMREAGCKAEKNISRIKDGKCG